MKITKEKKLRYIFKVYDELIKRGIKQEDIPSIIGKTGFINVMGDDDLAEMQLLMDVRDAVDEILDTADKNEQIYEEDNSSLFAFLEAFDLETITTISDIKGKKLYEGTIGDVPQKITNQRSILPNSAHIKENCLFVTAVTAK